MDKLGWCLDGNHKKCPHEVPGLVGDGSTVQFTGTTQRCGCPCHTKGKE